MSAPCPTLGFTIRVELDRASTDFAVPGDDLARLAQDQDLLLATDPFPAPRRLAFRVTREGSQATLADRDLLVAWAIRWRAAALISVSD